MSRITLKSITQAYYEQTMYFEAQSIRIRQSTFMNINDNTTSISINNNMFQSLLSFIGKEASITRSLFDSVNNINYGFIYAELLEKLGQIRVT
jgi:catabolite regulation protein CreA